MAPQEAINIIEDVTWQDNGRHYGKIVPAREIAISALKKQIPKKPSETDKARCIHCACVVKRDERFCKNCGQALDWSDSE